MDSRTRKRRLLGRLGESAAASYLLLTGHRILARNWRCRRGELDVVAERGGVVVFVEVRTRSRGTLVDPLLSVDPSKMARIIAAGRVFLASRGMSDRPCRFDVVAITVSRALLPRLRHVRRAFYGDSVRPVRPGRGAGFGRRAWSRG